DDGDHAAAGVALDAQLGHLLLQTLLHLLRLFHHLLNVHRCKRCRCLGASVLGAWVRSCIGAFVRRRTDEPKHHHISSTSLISAGNTSSSAWTPESASAC